MSVGELIACLRMFPDNMPLAAVYDCGTAEGNVIRVEMGPGTDKTPQAVLLVVE